MKKTTTKSKFLRADFTTYEVETSGGKVKKLELQAKNQKDIIHFFIKINGYSLGAIAEQLQKSQTSLFRTLERENLDYQDFLKIYEIATGKEYLTGLDVIDDLNGLYTLKLNQVVNLLEAEETPFVIGCGAYLYRLTNKNK